jgi:hypothetical protein
MIRSFMICTIGVFFGRPNHASERGEMLTEFWCGNPKEKNKLKDIGIDGRIILRGMLKSRMRAWTGLNWLRLGTNSEVL